MDKSTSRFLEILNKQNEAIAALAAEQENQEKTLMDPVRLQREQERREKWGQLRAREHPGRRQHRVRNIFPHSDPS